jgi:2-dehydro-3-deoxygluconokinase
MPRFVSVGECMIEMAETADGLYRMGYAGDTLNTAWYARARLPAEWEVDYVTALGDDHHSHRMAWFLDENGIGIGHIQQVAGRRPGLYLTHQNNGDPDFTYWRGLSAARHLADDAEAMSAAFSGVDIIHFSGITLAILDARARGRLMKALHTAREAGARISFDPNARPTLWTSPRVMASTISAAAILADVVLPTFADEEATFGDDGPETVAERYLAGGATEVIVKNGADPAFVAAPGACGWVPAVPVTDVVDATGAGDGFNGAYLAARALGASPLEAAHQAHLLAARVVGRSGALVPRAEI